MRASKGLMRGTRQKFAKGLREKFKPESFIQAFKPGDKVIIKIDSSVQKGMPHSRFKGKVGIVKCIRGTAFVIETYTGNMKKEICVRSEHLKRT